MKNSKKTTQQKLKERVNEINFSESFERKNKFDLKDFIEKAKKARTTFKDEDLLSPGFSK